MRLDKTLVERGIVASRTLAAKLVAAGYVEVNDAIVAKASYTVTEVDDIRVRENSLMEYVSRAGHKLAGALDVFSQVKVQGRRCLDAGASTGGFTDVLLRRGAAHIAAVDVGHDQIAPSIRQNPRVEVIEGLNVRYLKPADIGGRVSLVVSDLSFISLTLVMEALAGAAEPGADLVLMVKPQFEVGKHLLGSGGVVTDPHAHTLAVQRVQESAEKHGLRVRQVERSSLPGQDGNIEFFLWCTKPDAHPQ